MGCLSAHAQSPRGDEDGIQPSSATTAGDGDAKATPPTGDDPKATPTGDGSKVPTSPTGATTSTGEPKPTPPAKIPGPGDDEILRDLEMLHLMELLEAYDLFSDE
ncbi:MAG: hypothetical protein A2289_01370 [Deltaproteobacteria bacterium RIFOXYA12_FULL_58_15]|nr:MAG: hypothetical protein A2289_01370 [Deltaproteobacteria bacterium RIFOXYA12_FULL_58_15]OGR14038.1 MAG: hypothetical protein A2341_19025 [Deltaproteobacteria bacterium RIFOXYB12_FULL_58_9]